MRVAVLAGGRSSEHEVSLHSAEAVRDGVAAAGHEVLAVTIERSGEWTYGGEALSLRPAEGLLGADAVFPVLHGPFGEDGTVQGLLDPLDIPYVGGGVLASSLCMDKLFFKEVLAAADVPQVSYAGVRLSRWRAEPDAVLRELAVLGMPVFVKPARLGSSVGIAKVWSESELEPALDGAFAHDSKVSSKASRSAWRSRSRSSASTSPKRRSPARSCSRAPSGTTTRPSTPTGGRRWSSPRVWIRVLRSSAAWPSTRRAGRLRGAGAGGLLRRGRRAGAGRTS